MSKSNIIKDFRTFIERGNAIDMAVGIIVGSVMTGVVNSLVTDVIMPPIGLLIGGVDFSQLFIVLAGGEAGAHYSTISAAQAAGATTMNIGLFMNSIVSFFITMFAIFLFVRIVNKTRDKKASQNRACPYCMSSINISATKCPHCCSSVKPIEMSATEDSDLKKSVKKLTDFTTNTMSKIANGTISKISKKKK